MSRYFDIDSFLAEQTRVPVVFNSGCTGLGKEMDKMCQTRDLPMGEEVELPFWLVPKLFEQNMVGPKMPDCFDERVWQVVEAEPKNVPLRDFNPHFFEFGARFTELLRDEELHEQLEKAFTARYSKLLVGAALSTSEFKERHLLSKEEERLLDSGRDSMKAFHDWKYATTEKLTVAHTVKANKKRRAGGAYGSNQRRAMGDNLTNRV